METIFCVVDNRQKLGKYKEKQHFTIIKIACNFTTCYVCQEKTNQLS